MQLLGELYVPLLSLSPSESVNHSYSVKQFQQESLALYMPQLRNQVLTWGKDAASFQNVTVVFCISGKYLNHLAISNLQF